MMKRTHSVIFLVALSTAFLLSAAEPTTIRPDPAFVESVAKLIDECLTEMAEKTSDKDTQYYEKGVWHLSNGDPLWACGGPATAAAVLWNYRQKHAEKLDATGKARQEWLHRVSVETFDHAISVMYNADFTLKQKPSVESGFFTLALGNTYLELRESLDEATRKRWLDALVGDVKELIKTGDLPNPEAKGWKATDGWTTNGNVELCECELLNLAWKATGDQKYKDLFETQFKHTLEPDPQRWKGYGLFYLKKPTREDGSDGAGYLAEAEQEPGFDKDYTHFQLTIASRLYVHSRDPRVLRLMNLFLGALLPLVDQKTWILDATYGSRHSLHFPFFTCGMATTAWLGNRADLAPLIPDQFQKATQPFYWGNAKQNWGNPGAYRGYGADLAVFLQAALLLESEPHP
ncbi:MAG TPA: hypothetical protein VGP72_33345 [Planctomycetota bacterium]|jgi:hypothetical protein